MKKRTHTFQITVTFDRDCTVDRALREVRNDGNINAGTHYCINWYDPDGGPEKFRVKSIRKI